MATSSSSQVPAIPRIHRLELVEGMQLQQDYEDAFIEVQNQIAKGTSLNELHSSFSTSSTKRVVDNREQLRSGMTYSYKEKHNIDQWLQNHTAAPAKNTMPNSALMDLVDKSMGGVMWSHSEVIMLATMK